MGMRDVGRHRGMLRPGLFVLALLALCIQVLIPPGFMVRSGADTASLVICTGHTSPVALDPHHPGKTSKSDNNAPCLFAGHGLAAAPPTTQASIAPNLAAILATRAAYDAPAPGRGLAAPPPPARAPPVLI